jgi:hypothetical protein
LARVVAIREHATIATARLIQGERHAN